MDAALKQPTMEQIRALVDLGYEVLDGRRVRSEKLGLDTYLSDRAYAQHLIDSHAERVAQFEASGGGD